MSDPSFKRQVELLRSENDRLRAQLLRLEETDSAWLQRKVRSQQRALAALQQRVVNQRFVLATLDKLGRGLTRSEWDSHRSSRPDAQLDEALLVS